MYHQAHNGLTDLEYKQLCKSWSKILETLRADNAVLINHLSEVLKGTAKRSFIEEAEEFQLSMLDKEETLILLRHELREQLDWLESQPAEKEAPHQYATLKSDMEQMVQEYERMKAAFLAFVAAERV
ncbi:hypothetical protein CLV51_102700 [Chitinophaga niastensis]|uniref:Uncharacterized protein n=1 Tax=Chitinophaga niastensis TaxID=536980 RepID=A0A2P8HNP6_CHINA|nr:hypothetical protein [Chitinophaga niastensis]PSL47840.1 hypothetical protein CLV51_102700 [Chitinophaga niastensis]